MSAFLWQRLLYLGLGGRMGTAVMPQLCSGNLQRKGSLGRLNKGNSPGPEVTQIHPNAGKALAVVRRWHLPPSFSLEASSALSIFSIMFRVEWSFGYLTHTHTSGCVLWRLVVWVTDQKVFAPFLCRFPGFSRSPFVDFHHTFSTKPPKVLLIPSSLPAPSRLFSSPTLSRSTLCSAWIWSSGMRFHASSSLLLTHEPGNSWVIHLYRAPDTQGDQKAESEDGITTKVTSEAPEH